MDDKCYPTDPDTTEEDNFTCIAILLADNTRLGYVSLINLHLSRRKISFEQFLNDNQHEIHHLCYNDTDCCQCCEKRDNKRPSRKILAKKHIETLFDKSKRLYTHTDNNDSLCCMIAKSNIKVDFLDLNLAKILLIRFCRELFWYSSLEFRNKTFQAFLDENKHIIWHLWKSDTICCQCSKEFDFPSDKILLGEDHWNCLYEEKVEPCLQHTNKNKFDNTICAANAKKGIALHNIDPYAQDIILRNCCDLRKAVDVLDSITVRMYDACKVGRIRDKEFNKYFEEVKESLEKVVQIIGPATDASKEIFKFYVKKPSEVLRKVYQASILELSAVEESLHTSSQFQITLEGTRISDSRKKSSVGKENDDQKAIKSTDKCDVCYDYADGWCCHCEQLLCQSCILYHRKIKGTRGHRIIKINDYKQIPDIKESCQNHNEKFENFCTTHGEPFCKTCISHVTCTVVSLETYVRGIKDSKKFDDVKTVNDKLLLNISAIRDRIGEEIKSIPQKQQLFEDDVHSCKEKIEEFVFALHQHGLNSIFKQKRKMEAVYQQLSVCKDKIDQNNTDLDTLASFASESKTFLGLLEIEKTVKRSENNILDIFENNNISSISPKLKFNDETMKNHIFDIGLVPINCPSEILTLDKSSLTTDIQQMTLEKRLEFQVKSRRTGSNNKDIQIRGCSVLPDGTMWFTDRVNHCVIIHNSKGEYVKEIELEGTPIGLAPISENKVAISFENKAICFADIRNKNIDKTHFFYECPGKFGGVSQYKGKLLVRVGGFGYYLIDSKGEITRQIELPGSYMPYVTCSKDRMYFTKWDVKKVFCCKLSGEVIWEYDGDDFLTPPNGVAADECGNVFVTGTYSNNVLVISADGKERKELIAAGILKNPVPISYDIKTRRCLVTCMSGNTVLFSLKRTNEQ